MDMFANAVLHSRTKHIEIDLFFVCEKVVAKMLSVQYVPAEDQTADIFTKPLSSMFFSRLRNKLGIQSSNALEL